MTAASPLPLSRPIAVADLPIRGLAVDVSPTADENAAIAAFNGIVAVGDLRAELLLRAEGRQGVRVTGALRAVVTQTCVVSLDPFDSEIAQDIDVHFLTPEGFEAFRAARAKLAVTDAEPGPDEPDAIVDGRIDVGALVAEHLTLALDPYPRKPGAALPPEAGPAEPPASPFAVLRTLTEKRS